LAIRVIDIAMPNNSSQPFKIEHSLQPGVFVSGAQGEIEMVVLNLLTNAISALNINSPDPLIRVTLTTQAQDAIIEVKDNGVGVPEDQRQEIFNLFHTTKTQGMGVGLWLSRTIMENHQGGLELIQTTDAVTCFRITIPRMI
jgi:signal transduction histidine kinase